MRSKAIPDRWLNYTPVGQIITGTRFIAFKVPLREHITDSVKDHYRLSCESLVRKIPNLGMIIDLTNTNRYYSPEVFVNQGIRYEKLMIPGHEIPSIHLVQKFNMMVKDFLRSSSANNKIIGVHCTHGVNRTGYLICKFMISEMNIQAKDALNRFHAARGYKIERKNYVQDLTGSVAPASTTRSKRSSNWRNSQTGRNTTNSTRGHKTAEVSSNWRNSQTGSDMTNSTRGNQTGEASSNRRNSQAGSSTTNSTRGHKTAEVSSNWRNSQTGSDMTNSTRGNQTGEASSNRRNSQAGSSTTNSTRGHKTAEVSSNWRNSQTGSGMTNSTRVNRTGKASSNRRNSQAGNSTTNSTRAGQTGEPSSNWRNSQTGSSMTNSARAGQTYGDYRRSQASNRSSESTSNSRTNGRWRSSQKSV